MANLEAVQRRTLQFALHLYGLLPWPLRRALRFGLSATQLWVSEDGTELGSSIAFYSLFALAPLLVVAIAIAGEVFGADAARGQIVGQISGLVGADAADSIEKMIASAYRSDRNGIAALVGVITLLIGASGVFSQMRKALNRIGRVQPQSSAIGAFVRARLIAFALVLGFGFLIVASLLASAALSAMTNWLALRMPILANMLTPLDFAVSTIVLSVAFWAFLRWLPDRPPTMPATIVGALTSAVLFAIGKQLIGFYLGRVSTTSSFGAAGSLVVIMLWVYYSSQILLFGAAVAWSIDGVKAVDVQPEPIEKPGPKLASPAVLS